MKKHYALLGALFLAFGAPYWSGNAVYASPEPQVAAQATKVITGVVTDSNGEPVIGASVIEPGTTRGTVTNVDGKFSLRVSANAKVRISYVAARPKRSRLPTTLKSPSPTTKPFSMKWL